MNFYMETIKKILRSLLFITAVGIGLLTIVGTGGDDDDDSSANNAPVAQIDSPTESTVFLRSNSITFTGSATDTEDKVLIGNSLVWTSSVDGIIGKGSNFTRNDLSSGTHQITLTAIDSFGSADSSLINITVNPATNTLPTAVITSPASGTTYTQGNFIEFTGTGYDTEDDWLSDTSLVWHSNKDGQIGTGNSIVINSLSRGTHTISLTATDSYQTSNTATISIVVSNTAPFANISFPPDGSTFTLGESIPFNGYGTDTEDGNITDESLIWTASNYGIIGYGTNITIDFLPAGTDIIINLKAIDSGDLAESDNITITIAP